MDSKNLLDMVRGPVADGHSPGPAVRLALSGTADPVLLRRIGGVLADLPSNTPGLRSVRIAVLATGTVGPLTDLLRAVLVAAGAIPTIDVGEYGTFDLNLAGCLFARDTDPDFAVCLLAQEYFLPSRWQTQDVKDVIAHMDARSAELRGLITGCLDRTSATLIVHTVPLTRTVRDSFIAVRDRAVLAGAWHRLNAELLDLTATTGQIICVDFAGVLADRPAVIRDSRLYRYADLPYTDDALSALANEVRRVVQAKCGLSRKVLALDADNTLWGGVLGEVGAHGVQLGGLYPGNCYLDLQRTAAKLRDQGVILVLVSKNDAQPVHDVLTRHPVIQLRPESFAVLAANWDAKAHNLCTVAESLGLATDSFVFMDDSHYERAHVQDELPEVAVVPADGDPARLVESLVRPGWFDVLELTDTDRRRPELYRSRTLRSDYSAGFGSSADYLRALDIRVVVRAADRFSTSRVTQLAARTNQFNLTGIRFDEPATTRMITSVDHLVATFAVTDRFGDEGIVGACWVACGAADWRVLNLVLSCRVLGRGVELAITDWLFARARTAGASRITADFVPTEQNKVAADLWERAGLFAAATEPGGARTFACEIRDAPCAAPDWVTWEEEPDER